mmetsp:Transcript_17589/g.56026  ORF Transcript_17589/g.56026 Transcript_17589/m.56026 type:complete len:149 (-) Transcript_17589:236-682(-)
MSKFGPTRPAPVKASASRAAPSRVACHATLKAQLTDLQRQNEALIAEKTELAEAQEEVQSSLACALEREGALAAILSSGGINAMARAPIDWSTEDAKQALAEDEARAKFCEQFDARIRSGRERMARLLSEQKAMRALLDQPCALACVV